jgi:hypothetical protein
MLWKRASRRIGRLPDARRALAERYTIDAGEVQRREQVAAEAEAARQAAEEEAARRGAAEDEAARRAADDAAARRAAEEQAARHAAPEQAEAEVEAAAVVPEGEAEEEHSSADTELSSELPIYRWFDGA